jgi:integral membrane protein
MMKPLRRLRIAGLIEGSTLLVLILIAVPMKHIIGIPQFVSVMGPLHGIAFLAYLRFWIMAVAEGGWKRGDIIRTGVVSFIPFGTFYNDRYLKRMEAEKGISAS